MTTVKGPNIIDAPCGLQQSQLSASPGFSYGRPGVIASGAPTFLNRPGGTPSNNTGVDLGLSNASLDVISTGTRVANSYTLTIYQHDGGFESPTVIATVSIVATKKAVLVNGTDFTQTNPLVKNRHVAVQVSAGSADNIGVDLQFSGDAT